MFVGSSSTGLEIGASPWCGGGAIEETVSRSGLVRLYCEEARKVGVRNLPDPADPAAPPIVAAHARAAEGPQGEAARQALKRFGEACGFGIAWAVNLLDPDLVVVGGGVAGAWDLFFPHLWAYLRSRTPSGRPRIFKRLFDLSDPGQREEYLQDESAVMAKKKTGILRSSLSTDRAVMLGAYEVALRSGRLKL